jgi:basic membrane lipoprotein Med (substrate-binding protein (PBP1-ABC) superfamily)
MKFISKKLLGGMLLTSVLPTALLLASCASNAEESVFDTGITQETENYYGQKLEAVSPDVKVRKTILLTAGGSVNDKAFNQSALESMKLYQKQAGILDDGTISYKETIEDEKLSAAYTYALDNNFKT